MPLEDRVAIVTGSGGGLGRTHALYLASKGAKVVVCDLSSDAVDGVVAEIRGAGGIAEGAVASVTDLTAVEAMVAETIARWGRVDILVNNAGILRDKTFAKGSLDDFRLVLDVHLMGSVNCTKAVWDAMRAQSFGRIVFTTSSSGLYGNFGQANYAAAKMALVGLMQTLALEGAKYNVRVNCLAPTAATQMTNDLFPEDVLAQLKPEYVSPGLLALVGDDAPTRAILCAGAGHFSVANVTMSRGAYIGVHGDAGELLVEAWDEVSSIENAVIPGSGAEQGQQELTSALEARRPVAEGA